MDSYIAMKGNGGIGGENEKSTQLSVGDFEKY